MIKEKNDGETFVSEFYPHSSAQRLFISFGTLYSLLIVIYINKYKLSNNSDK